MNSIHDLGGMAGFGPIEREENEPVFHSEWERRVFAVNMAAMGAFGPIDRMRHAVERLDADQYLMSTYYARWIAAVELVAKELGVLTEEEIVSGVAKPADPPPEPPPNADIIEAIVKGGMPASRDTGRLEPRFAEGGVRARNINPPGHTRLPRYVRGRVGIVDRIHGTHVFPDTNARLEGEGPQPRYNVRFEATELWGPAAPKHDRLYIDMWEDYLEPAGEP